MSVSVDTNDFTNMTNKWNQIFVDFIDLIFNENSIIYEERIFKILRLSTESQSPSKWTDLFIENFTMKLIYDYEGPEYSEVFMNCAFTHFNETPITEEIIMLIQYLKYLCVDVESGENYYENFYNNENTEIMNNEEQLDYCKSLIINISMKFLEKNKNFIKDIFNDMLSPTTFLK